MVEKNKKSKTKESPLEDKVTLEGDIPTWRECLPIELIKIKRVQEFMDHQTNNMKIFAFYIKNLTNFANFTEHSFHVLNY